MADNLASEKKVSSEELRILQINILDINETKLYNVYNILHTYISFIQCILFYIKCFA